MLRAAIKLMLTVLLLLPFVFPAEAKETPDGIQPTPADTLTAVDPQTNQTYQVWFDGSTVYLSGAGCQNWQLFLEREDKSDSRFIQGSCQFKVIPGYQLIAFAPVSGQGPWLVFQGTSGGGLTVVQGGLRARLLQATIQPPPPPYEPPSSLPDPPVKVAIYGPEGQGPYSEHPCSPQGDGVFCDFSGAPAMQRADRYFGVIFAAGWGHIQGPNGPRAGGFEVVDGRSRGFVTSCPPGCQTVALLPFTGQTQGEPLVFAHPVSGVQWKVERVSDTSVRIVPLTEVVISPPPPPPPLPPSPPSGKLGAVVIKSGSLKLVIIINRDATAVMFGGSCSGLIIYNSPSPTQGGNLLAINGCSFSLVYRYLIISNASIVYVTGCPVMLDNNIVDLLPCGIGVAIQPPSPPPPSCFSILSSYDRNYNSRLDDPEFFDLIEAWVRGQIDNSCFFEAVDLWVRQAAIGVFGNQVFDENLVSLLSFGRNNLLLKLPFSTEGQIAVFDLQGRVVLKERIFGRVKLLSFPRLPANGVYIYTLRYKDGLGRLKVSVGKFIVLR